MQITLQYLALSVDFLAIISVAADMQDLPGDSICYKVRRLYTNTLKSVLFSVVFITLET